MADTPNTPKQKGWNPTTPDPLPPKDTRGKVNLRPADFDKLVQRQGVRIKVFRTSYCPNVKSVDGAEHEIDCPLCHGAGFLDRYCIDTWGFLQSIELNKAVLVEGLYDGNSLSATFMQGVELQYFTLVELQDFTDIFIERIKKQDGITDVLRYPGLRVNMLVDKQGLEYFEGSDFKLDQNGNIQWCGKRDPDRGTIYTINYETKIRFRAIKAMHSNRFTQIAVRDTGATQLLKMNEQWLLQKEYLVVRKDINGKVIKPNKIRDSDQSDSESDEY